MPRHANESCFVCRLLAAPTVLAQTPTIRIHAAMVIDGTGKLQRNATVVVQGSKITAIESGNANATYDLGQLTILPGHDRRACARGLALRQGRPIRSAPRIAVARNSLQRGKCLRDADGRLHDDPEPWLAERCRSARRDRARRAAGPRILTSIRLLNEQSGTPDEIRQKVRQLKTDGADVIKIFASASIRDGGKQTMTDEQLHAACGEANAIGIRTMVHAHSPESIKASVNAGCKQIEHGVFATDEVLKLMADKGVYFDPNVGVVLQNYLKNKAHTSASGTTTRKASPTWRRGCS